MTHKETIEKLFRHQKLIISSCLKFALIILLLILITVYFAMPSIKMIILACIVSLFILPILYLSYKLRKIYVSLLILFPFELYLTTLDKNPIHTIQAALLVMLSAAVLITISIKIVNILKRKKQSEQSYLAFIEAKKQAKRNATMQAAILLKQIYPATSSQLKNHSFIGGKPELPEELLWPVTNDGRPMHFLAQIDLSYLPEDPPCTAKVEPLPDFPRQGLLYFFALCDSDLGEDEAQFRVLYSPEYTPISTETIIPENLQDLTGDGPLNSHNLWDLYNDDNYKGALKPQFFPKVAIEPIWYISNPSHNALYENMKLLTQSKSADILRRESQLQRYLLSEIIRLPEWSGSKAMSWARWGYPELNWPWLTDLLLSHQEESRNNLAYAKIPETFPWRWMQIEKIAQAIYVEFRKAEKRKAQHPDAFNQFYELCQPELQTAKHWLELAVSHGWFTAVSKEQALKFRNWLQTILNYQYKETIDHPDAISNSVIVTSTMQHILKGGFFGSWPYIAAEGHFEGIPESFVMRLKNGHAPCNCGEFQVHQMFGAAHEIQYTDQVEEKLLLIQFASDKGADMLWGDVGMIQLWIDRSDLKKADFSQVELTMSGH